MQRVTHLLAGEHIAVLLVVFPDADHGGVLVLGDADSSFVRELCAGQTGLWGT